MNPPAADAGAGQGTVAADGSLTVVGAKAAPATYVPVEATSPLKVPVKTIETPVNVQVITPELINDQQAFRLQDALRNVAGVGQLKNESNGQEYDTSTIRGFSQRPFRGGLRTLGSDTIDMSSVERVEVIKGPDAVTFGDAQPGGIVNIITKGANLSPFGMNVVGALGSYDSSRWMVDVGGRISDDADANAGVRLSVARVDDHSFRDYVYHDSMSVSPAFFWQIGDQTSLDVRGTFKHENRMLDPGIYFDINHKAVASIDTFLGDPSTEGLTVDDRLIDATFTHTFLPMLSMRTRGVYHDLFIDIEAIRTTGNPNAANTIARRYDASDVDLYEFSLSNDFIVKFRQPSSVDVTLVVGADYRRMHKIYTNKMDNTLSRISIIDPVYDFDPDTANVVAGAGNENLLDAVGIYAQGVFVTLEDKLHMMLGGRFDSVDSTAINGVGVETDGKTTGNSWQVGALYKLLPYLYPYATVSTSFDPVAVNRVDVNGDYLDPETGIQYEAGIKAPFFNEAFAVTASVYHIDKQDVAIADPDNAGFAINGGELSSEGFELTAGGNLTPGLGVYASYAYTDTKVEKSDTLPEGEQFQGIPLHSGSLWMVYTLHETRLAGLRLGGGAFLVGERNGDTAATFTLPSYTTYDAMIGYRCAFWSLRSLTLQLNVKNIFDKEYYESGSGYSFMPGGPRSFTVSMDIAF